MKALFAAPLFVLGLSSIAHAEYLPSVKNVNVQVVSGGGLAAVQPYTLINVTINSCAPRRDLSVKTTKLTDGTVKIKVLDGENAMDCRALGVDREYTLQVSSDATGEKYVLLNPIAPSYQ